MPKAGKNDSGLSMALKNVFNINNLISVKKKIEILYVQITSIDIAFGLGIVKAIHKVLRKH